MGFKSYLAEDAMSHPRNQHHRSATRNLSSIRPSSILMLSYTSPSAVCCARQPNSFHPPTVTLIVCRTGDAGSRTPANSWASPRVRDTTNDMRYKFGISDQQSNHRRQVWVRRPVPGEMPRWGKICHGNERPQMHAAERQRKFLKIHAALIIRCVLMTSQLTIRIRSSPRRRRSTAAARRISTLMLAQGASPRG
jgi:hypothetical protein